MARTDNLNHFLTDVADAIRTKTGSQSSIPAANFDTEIENIPSGGTTEEKSVYFYDYDGTVLYSYTKSEFLALTSLPNNPSHTGLTAEGWNWNLSDAQSYVTDNGYLDIGQIYNTDDGKTRIYVSIPEERRDPYLGFSLTGNATIDWGDGNSQTVTGVGSNLFTRHNYSQAGDYVITIDSEKTITISGYSVSIPYLLYGGATSGANVPNRFYANMVKRIHIGNNVALRAYAFASMVNLEYITIPLEITVTSNQGNMFNGCFSLKHINLPNNNLLYSSTFTSCKKLESISFSSQNISGLRSSVFNQCYSLKHITLPLGSTSIENSCFSNCSSLERIVMPNTVTNISSYGFQYCQRLTQIIGAENVLTIGSQAFQYCGIKNAEYSHATSVGNYAFSNCRSLVNASFATATSIGNYAFENDYALESISFPSIQTISEYAFTSCYNIDNVSFPNSLLSIGNSAFSNCGSLRSVDLENTQITAFTGSVFGANNFMSSFKLPSGVTELLSYFFNGCMSLKSITLPEGMTSIPSGLFNQCFSLDKLVIPSTVTSIANQAFNQCNGMKLYDFTALTSVPTLSHTNAFQYIPSDCVIIVPDDLYDTWIAATNWSNYASYIKKESEV